jgi:non-specific serine/threonine protein kinase
MIGKTISHYKIIENIGSGGMGVVYKAQDLKLERKVAIKFLPEHLTEDKDNVERFEREAKAAAALSHPNIVTIYDVLEEDDQICIVMEYVDGKSLREVINEYDLGLDKTIDVISQISEGLSQAHQAGIVHRDIKPENIIIDKDARVKILDFGLAKLKGVSKLTKETSTLGTIHYMSPEQLQGKEVDHRSDIWSLGVVLYELLTGEVPFKGEYESAVMYAVLNENIKPMTDKDTPEELDRIIEKCLTKDPADRYQHIDELIVDLKGLKSESTNITSKKEKQEKRSKSVLLSVAILSILILIVLGYFLIQPDEKSPSGWENSIAVLPFDNISNDPEQDYFAEGMTEQIISNLSRLPRLKVIARQSVMKYKDSDKIVSEIGEELNVAYVLESSIRKSGNRIRVTAQLITTKDNFHVWSKDYDRDYKEELFYLQDELSQAIASNLLATLSPQEKKEIKTNRPSNTEAYEYLLKGKYLLLKYFQSFKEMDIKSSNLQHLISAERMFKKAIKLDPNYADLYANLADTYNTFFNLIARTVEEKEKYMKLQEAYLDTAFGLDSSSAEVYSVKGMIHETKGELHQAFHSYKKAIKINPNNDEYFRNLGNFLKTRGCINLAIRYWDKAIEINPLIDFYYRERGRAYISLLELDKAERDMKKALEINPDHFGTFTAYLQTFIVRKRFEEADKLLAHFKQTHPNLSNSTYGFLDAIMYAVRGQKENALNASNNRGAQFFVYPVLGMKDDAIKLCQEYSEKLLKREQSFYLEFKNLWFLENIRSDPRFQEILAKHKELYEENLRKYGDLDI